MAAIWGPWVTAMSAQASDMSAWLLMGLPGSILAFGFGQIWIGIGLALGTIANWVIVARRLRCFSEAANDSITLPQYLPNRFATKSLALQIICAVIFLVCFTIYVARVCFGRNGLYDGVPGACLTRRRCSSSRSLSSSILSSAATRPCAGRTFSRAF